MGSYPAWKERFSLAVLEAQAIVNVAPCVRCLLYRITAPSGKLYIGVTNHLAERMNTHLHGKRGLLGSSLRKYGVEAHRIEVLLVGERGYIYDLEKAAIAAFGTLSPNGLNLAAGGDGCSAPSAETRKRMSKSRSGAKHSLETKAKIALSNSSRGCNQTTKAKIAQSLTGKVQSEDTRAKRSAALKRYWDSERAIERRIGVALTATP